MDQPSASNDILAVIKDGIGRVTLNRPQARNTYLRDVREAHQYLRTG